jgi:hypothetical protein
VRNAHQRPQPKPQQIGRAHAAARSNRIEIPRQREVGVLVVPVAEVRATLDVGAAHARRRPPAPRRPPARARERLDDEALAAQIPRGGKGATQRPDLDRHVAPNDTLARGRLNEIADYVNLDMVGSPKRGAVGLQRRGRARHAGASRRPGRVAVEGRSDDGPFEDAGIAVSGFNTGSQERGPDGRPARPVLPPALRHAWPRGTARAGAHGAGHRRGATRSRRRALAPRRAPAAGHPRTSSTRRPG